MNKLVKKTLNAIVFVSSLCSISAYSMNIWKASRKGNVKRVRELIAAGVNVGRNDIYGDCYTPLHWAAEKGHLEIVKLLISAHANVYSRDVYGKTPLHLAAYNSRQDVVRTLVKYFTDAGLIINLQDTDGRTPLHLAAFALHPGGIARPEISRILIDAGANLNQQDFSGMTPLQLAAESDRPEVVSILLEAGADVDNFDEDAKTRLRLSCRRGILDLIDSFQFFHRYYKVIAQMTALLGAAVHERLGSNSPAQLLSDQYLAHEIGKFVLQAAEETAIRRQF